MPLLLCQKSFGESEVGERGPGILPVGTVSVSLADGQKMSTRPTAETAGTFSANGVIQVSLGIAPGF
jgi:hypothetical protein